MNASSAAQPHLPRAHAREGAATRAVRVALGRRGSGIAGVLFFVLVMSAPEPRLRAESPAPEALKAFYLGSAASFRWSLLLVALAYALLLALVAMLAAEVAAATREARALAALLLAAGALAAAFAVIAVAVRSVPGLDLVSAETPAAQVEAWSQFASEAYDTLVEAATFWRGLLLAAVALAVLAYGTLPRWLGWIAAALAFGHFVGPAVGWFRWPLEPAGFVLGYGSYIAFHFWVLAVGVALILGRTGERAPGAGGGTD